MNKKTRLITTLLILTLTLTTITLVGASEPGTVAVWHFDEGIGPLAYDSAGYDNFGILSGGKFGNALDFDGDNDYVLVPDSDSLDVSTFTLEAWIYPRSLPDTWPRIIHKGNYEFDLYVTDTNLATNIDGTAYYSDSGIITLNEWQHVAVTCDGTYVRFYRNNVLVGEHTTSNTASPDAEPLYIGNRADLARDFDGLIDEVRISNTAYDFFDLNNPPTNIYKQTVALWHFDESVGNTVYDATSNNNDGTIVGATWAGPVWVDGLYGKALEFTGDEVYVDGSHPDLSGMSELTVETWFYVKDYPELTGHPGLGALATKWYQSTSYDTYGLWISHDHKLVGALGPQIENTIRGTTDIPLNTWHHAALVYDSTMGTAKLYLDGQLEATKTGLSGDLNSGFNPLYIGTDYFGTSTPPYKFRYFDGIIDETRIWETALSDEAIKAHANGLVGEWDFENDLKDTSGFENHGAFIGTESYVPGKIGQGIDFDGVNEYVTVPDSASLDITEEVTVEAWVYIDTYDNGKYYEVAGKWDDHSGDYRSYLLCVKGQAEGLEPRFYVSNAGDDYPAAVSSINIPTGEWHHLAGTFDGTAVKIYVDGVETGITTPAESTLFSNEEPFLMAGNTLGGSNGRYLDGKIDEVKVWANALVPVAFTQTGLDACAEDTVVTVADPIDLDYDDLPYVMMVPEGTEVYYDYTDEISFSGNSEKKFVLTGGDDTGNPAISGPTVFTGVYTTQYYLTVDTLPAGLHTFSEQGWYDEGTEVELTAPVVGGYTFLYWELDDVDKPYGQEIITVTMDGPHTAVAHYFTWITVSGTKYEDIDGSQLESDPIDGWPIYLGYCDDFEDGANYWNKVSGTWSIEDDSGNKVYSGTASDDEQTTYVYSPEIYNDFSVEVDLKAVNNNGHYGIILREYEGTHYGFYLNAHEPSEGKYYFGYWDGTGYTPIVPWTSSEGAYTDATTWNTLKVVAEGYTFELYINDQLVNTVTDSSEYAWFGHAGLIVDYYDQTDGQQTYYDDFCVNSKTTTMLGDYVFDIKAPGTYYVKEALPDGWTQTYPNVILGEESEAIIADGYTLVIGEEATDVVGKDFWNFEWTEVSGVKFFDGDNDGVKHTSEPGLEYWTIELYDYTDTKIGETTTDEDGYYEFTIKHPGTYTVKEVLLEEWWTRTNGDHTFTVSSGETEYYDFGNWLGPSEATTSGLCWFDLDPDTEEREFKLIFTPNVDGDPLAYKLSASNPGQFYYNVFDTATSETKILQAGDIYTIEWDEPFVLQGANPVHVYSGVNTGPGGCLVVDELEDISYLFDIEIGKKDNVITLMYDPDDPYPTYEGFLYINVHFDYGLKGTGGYDLLAETEEGPYHAVAKSSIYDGTEYSFRSATPFGILDSESVYNINVFKKIRGFIGLVTDDDDKGLEGYNIRITLDGVTVGTAVTDEDGFYGYIYKHTGKPTDYTVQLWNKMNDILLKTKTVKLKANGYGWVSFTLP